MARKTQKRNQRKKSSLGRVGRNKILTVVLLLVLAGSLAVFAFGGSIYRGGWETTTTLADITVDGVTYNIDNQPNDTLTWGAFEATFDADGDYHDGIFGLQVWDGHGLPDLTFSITYPREYVINDYGEWSAAMGGQVFDEVVKVVDEDTVYFWDHHVFFFEFSITAEPEGIGGAFNPDGEGYGNDFSEIADVAARVNFKASDWLSSIVSTTKVGDMELTLDRDSVWSGVMSASVFDYEINLGEAYLTEGYVDVKSKGAVNTYYPDTYTTSNEISFYDGQSTAPLAGVPDSLDIELAARLSPAHTSGFTSYDGGFCSVKWRIRVDVLTSAGYVLESGNIEDYIDAAGSHRSGTELFGESFFRALGSVFGLFGADYELGIVMAILIILFLVIIVGVILKAFAGGGGAVDDDGYIVGGGRKIPNIGIGRVIGRIKGAMNTQPPPKPHTTAWSSGNSTAPTATMTVTPKPKKRGVGRPKGSKDIVTRKKRTSK